MKHYAKIENETVVRVIVLRDEDSQNAQTFIANTLMLSGLWIPAQWIEGETLHNAGIGYRYHPDTGIFSRPDPVPAPEEPET